MAGYLVATDVTAREVQRRHEGQWSKGKSLGRMRPGPRVLSRTEIPDPQDLTIRCVRNDEVVQETSTAPTAFVVARAISRNVGGDGASAGTYGPHGHP